MFARGILPQEKCHRSPEPHSHDRTPHREACEGARNMQAHPDAWVTLVEVRHAIEANGQESERRFAQGKEPFHCGR